MPKYTWKPSTTGTTTYILEKSTNHGLTWAALASITHDYTGANYDSSVGRFFFDDITPVVGELVRIYGQSVEGDGPAAILHGPLVANPTCHLYGVIIHTVTGEPSEGAEVRVSPLSDRRKSTLIANAGIPAANNPSTLGGDRVFRTFTDAEGQWKFDLLRGIAVECVVPSTGFRQSLYVPDDRDVLNIADAHMYRSGTRFQGSQNNPAQHGPAYIST